MPSRVVNKPKPGNRRYVTKWIGKRRILPLEPYENFASDGSTLVEKFLCFAGILQVYHKNKGWVDIFWELRDTGG